MYVNLFCNMYVLILSQQKKSITETFCCYLKGIYVKFLETSRLCASSGVIFRYITYEDKNRLILVFEILLILKTQKV